MRWVEAVVKLVWGTDEKCHQRRELEQGERMIAEAERKVEALHETLDRPRNLDETLYQMTHGGRNDA